MYWADLSRVGSGLFSILGTIYQLILHISHLGRKTLDVGAQYAPDPRNQRLNESWRLFSSSHAWAVRLFTIGVPVAITLMLCCDVLFIPAGLRHGIRPTVGIASGVVAALLALGLACFTKLRTSRAATTFVAGSVVILSIGAWLWSRLPAHAELLGTGVLTVLLATLTAGLYDALLRRYERSRPGVLMLGRAAAIALLLFTAWSAWRLADWGLKPAELVRQVAFFAFQWGYLGNLAVWFAVWAVALFAVVVGIRVFTLTDDPAARLRMRHAAWTSRVTLCGSLFAFILMTLIGFEAILSLVSKHTFYFDLLPKAQLKTVLPWFLPAASGGASEFILAMIGEGGTAALPWIITGLGVALLLILWFIVLIAVTNLRVPSPDWRLGTQLGEWLTAGFLWLRRSGNLATSVIYGGFVVGGVVGFAPRVFGVRWCDAILAIFDPHRTVMLITAITVAVLASAATVAAVKVRLDALAAQARPAIGILLDIDNYLRESPKEATPRARMAERFGSLLRHVVARRHADGSLFFDRIVLISHSQGTVLTADLLRFLASEGIVEPEIRADRFRLITMGSPLRQLYAANFPYLYQWVDASANVRPPLPGRALEGKTPDPTELNVGKWVNLYTTGDYIGRTLWRSEDAAYVWAREPFDGAVDTGDRRERCLGAGTHTHYWTSADVAQELDALMS
jgi:hypothetical protein